ncbi:hypothetical protein ACSHWB_30100 [Lentzea sp. HUAS TT2]
MRADERDDVARSFEEAPVVGRHRRELVACGAALIRTRHVT